MWPNVRCDPVRSGLGPVGWWRGGPVRWGGVFIYAWAVSECCSGWIGSARAPCVWVGRTREAVTHTRPLPSSWPCAGDGRSRQSVWVTRPRKPLRTLSDALGRQTWLPTYGEYLWVAAAVLLERLSTEVESSKHRQKNSYWNFLHFYSYTSFYPCFFLRIFIPFKLALVRRPRSVNKTKFTCKIYFCQLLYCCESLKMWRNLMIGLQPANKEILTMPCWREFRINLNTTLPSRLFFFWSTVAKYRGELSNA